MPQYASTHQRVLSVELEIEGNKPVRILEVRASIWVFDWDGTINEGLQKAASQAMSLAFSPEKREAVVVDLGSRQRRKQFEDDYRWTPTREDLELVAADLWPKSKQDRLKSAEGTAQRRPPLTCDARHALQEASREFFKINLEIERLKEPSVKGFIFAAREHAENFPEEKFLYRALAEMGERRLEILRRRRSGKGVWYAVVELTKWESDHTTTVLARYHERCDGKAAAVKAARRMLAEHAEAFSDDISVEASILTDLEWRE